MEPASTSRRRAAGCVVSLFAPAAVGKLTDRARMLRTPEEAREHTLI